MKALEEQVGELSARVENLERFIRKFTHAYNEHNHCASNNINIYSPAITLKTFQTLEEIEEEERREAMYAEEERKAKERTDYAGMFLSDLYGEEEAMSRTEKPKSLLSRKKQKRKAVAKVVERRKARRTAPKPETEL
jgi:hypothetical protein